jgi:hypothetical protein
MAVKSKANPMQTRNGRPRLGPLNIAQLTKILENSSTRNKTKAKIQNRIRTLKSRPGYVEPVVAEESVD